MITVTRRNGTTFALNPDLIERVEATPDTVVTLVSGTKYVVAESVDDIVAKVCHFRAAVLTASTSPQAAPTPPARLHSISTTER
ncbi:flagellar FlbD family protein [Austwickia chelonae]|uniref:flagellar FlbD family protein n=1 Tax=Austwickia chelonae TaxID=100225 RepID=UPI000E24351A|nr:flagellar FlbD family protein [Austwickia chelonae]